MTEKVLSRTEKVLLTLKYTCQKRYSITKKCTSYDRKGTKYHRKGTSNTEGTSNTKIYFPEKVLRITGKVLSSTEKVHFVA